MLGVWMYCHTSDYNHFAKLGTTVAVCDGLPLFWKRCNYHKVETCPKCRKKSKQEPSESPCTCTECGGDPAIRARYYARKRALRKRSRV